MKKKIFLVLFSLTCFQAGFAEPTYIGKASGESARIAKRNQWQAWGFAVSAVAIAVVGLILVSSHEGNDANS